MQLTELLFTYFINKLKMYKNIYATNINATKKKKINSNYEIK